MNDYTIGDYGQGLPHELEGGDPRYCRIHRGVQTSSRDGMFDAPCYVCEGEMAQLDADEQQAEYDAQPLDVRLVDLLAGAASRRLVPSVCPVVDRFDFSDVPF